MELLIGVVGGILASAIVGACVYLFRRFWNPIVWTLERQSGDIWLVTRAASRPALDVFMRRPENLDGRIYPRSYSHAQNTSSDTIHDASLEFVLDGAHDHVFALRWIQRDRRREALVTLLPYANRVELKRKEFSLVPLSTSNYR